MSKRRSRSREFNAKSPRAHQSLIEQLETRTLLATGPTAKLFAGPMETWGPTYTFKVSYTSDQRMRPSSIDGNDILITGPNGYSRLARFVSMVDNKRTITARYKVSTPRNIWDASVNGTYTFTMVANQVRDVENRYVPAGKLGTFLANVPSFPTALGQVSFDPQNGAVNVRDFGATPDDGIDDSRAIQDAINSLPAANGIATGAEPIGGIVYLPKGNYTISRPLMISSAIVLRGEGQQTILTGTSGNSSDSVVRVHSQFGHGFMIRAGVQNLSINSNVSKGIDVSTATSDGDVVGLRFSNLWISTGGAGIDLRGKDVYQSTVENVTFTNMGSTALAITVARPAGNSAINYIRNIVVDGVARGSFAAEEGLVILKGDFNVDGLDVGDIGKRVTPLAAARAVNLRNLVLRAGSKNLPNGVLAKFDDGNFQVDWIDNIGPGRTLQFSRTTASRIGTLRLADGATVQNAVAIDGNSHIAAERLQSNTPLPDVDARRFSAASITAPDASRRASVTVIRTLDGPAAKRVVNATSFGVVANDGADDTDALQAAINSLPFGDGVPSATGDVGGTIYLPAGKINLSRPIEVPSGVWLIGQGNATVLYNASGNQGDAAIKLVSGAAPGFNNGAGISDLALYTVNTAGIRGDASVVNGIFDLTIDGLTLSTGGAGIDLRAVKTFAANINNIGVPSAGSSVIWIGDDAGYSADNRVNDIQVYNGNRANYRNDKALFVFRGQNTIENLWIENISASVLPLYVSGRASIFGTWLEPPIETVPNDIAAEFENASNVVIDRFLSIDLNRQLKLTNSNVTLGHLNIAGYVNTLSQTVQIDSTSRINIGWVNAIYDVGMADDPRVTIGGVYNQNAGAYVDYSSVMGGQNLLQGIGAWTIQWGDNFGSVQGNASIENTAGGPRLRIEIFSNPNNRPVSVFINASVPGSAVGSPAGASWRVDGSETLVYTRGFGNQFQARITGSATVVPLPGVLSGNDQIVVMLLNKSSGVSYLSDFRLVAL